VRPPRRRPRHVRIALLAVSTALLSPSWATADPSPGGSGSLSPSPSAPVPSAIPAASSSPSPPTSPVALPTPVPAPDQVPSTPPWRAAGTRGWISRIDRLVAGRRVSVTVGVDGRFAYRHLATARRIPASNEKLLLSMALLDRLGPSLRVPTLVRSDTAPDERGVIEGNLWILGRGDPEVDRATMNALARGVRAAGVTQIRGRVRGSTRYFARDWSAVGWKPHFTADEVPFPTALTFLGNVSASGRHIDDPERRAAAALTSRLRARGIRVTGTPGAGRAPGGLVPVTETRSAALKEIVRRMDVDSLNFSAEVLGKLLARLTTGTPATIARGAAAIAAFEHEQGVSSFEHHDSSGLSYANRVRTQGIVKLLWSADSETWGPVLRAALPRGGQGTLRDRLHHVKVRAKTGTLDAISALSGWVWLQDRGEWGEFSIVSRGLTKTAAVRIEDEIVRTVSAHAG
jgi:D-alanyl-D-alanine carboxypeptidase/D-alanyl-D-alanine-endopeptidase (penicillin-binding protein 4)